MQIGASGPRGKCMKHSTLGFRSKVKITQGITLDPFGRLAFLVSLLSFYFCFFCRAMLCISAIYAILWCTCLSVRPSVCLSVCLSVSLAATFVYCSLSKPVIITSNFFSQSNDHIIVVFPYKPYGNLFRRGPLTGAIFFSFSTIYQKLSISGFGIDDCWTVECRQHFDCGVRL